MRSLVVYLMFLGMVASLSNCAMKKLGFEQYPQTFISNDEILMKLFLPDPEGGMYRATRFDWSGVIGSVLYKGHEYFGYWKDTHDPMFHEDLTGPVEGFSEPGLGYAEAKPGGKFIRIGVGVLEKEDEPEYDWRKTYKILDHGKWTYENGKDWIRFTHEIDSDLGYGYIYQKKIQLKSDGFLISHKLKNTGEKIIETDQFNHNFFMIDGEETGPAFKVSFPFNISTEDDLKGYLDIRKKDLNFIKELNDDFVFLNLGGYGKEVGDHQVSVLNGKSGAGVTFTVDKPLYKMVFWAIHTTLCPENFIWLSVDPGEEENWISEYTLTVQ